MVGNYPVDCTHLTEVRIIKQSTYVEKKDIEDTIRLKMEQDYKIIWILLMIYKKQEVVNIYIYTKSLLSI